MKSFLSVSLFGLLSSASVLPRSISQLPTAAGVRKAFKIENIPPVIVPQGKRIRVTYGPYTIRSAKGKSALPKMSSMSMDPAGTSFSDAVASDFPRDIIIVTSNTNIVDSNFKPVSTAEGIYTHHATFLNYLKRAPNWFACNGKPVGDMTAFNIFAGAGSEVIEFPPGNLSIPSGQYIGKTDPVVLSIDLVNYNEKDMEVYVQSEMEYVEGWPKGFAHGETRQIPVAVCDGKGAFDKAVNIHPPPGEKKFVLKGKEDMEILTDGYLRATYAHMHDGGINMVFTVNGKEVCTSNLEYGGPGHEYTEKDGSVWKSLSKTEGCPDAIPVKKGDKFGFSAAFDFEKYPARHSVGGEESESMALGTTTFIPLVVPQ